jgi:nitroreductase
MLEDLVLKNRSYRRFHQDVPVAIQTLRELVDLARITPSGRNLQPLKYVLACDPQTNAAIFSTLSWAGYLVDWHGPVEGERPPAYIVVLGDTTLSQSFAVDQGIASQTILLAATERGLGGCNVGSIQRDALRQILDIPARYEILIVLALGRPKETVVLEDMDPEGDVRYWRDASSVHHVPKRLLQDVILSEKG